MTSDGFGPVAVSSRWSARRNASILVSGRTPFSRSCREPVKPFAHGGAGTTHKGFDAARAHWAARNAPEGKPACATTTASDRATSTRFRMRKAPPRAGLAGAKGQIMAPGPVPIVSNRLACSGGKQCSHPVPATAQVRPAASRAPRCAASIPTAPPDTTTAPVRTSAAASKRAKSSASALASREPTMATAHAASSDPPRTVSDAGGRTSDRSRVG
jgi:hypothetical protein